MCIRDRSYVYPWQDDISLRGKFSVSELKKMGPVSYTHLTPIQNKLMQKLMQYAKKVMVTVTIDERENPYHVEGEHQLFYLSKKTVAGLKRLAQEVDVREEEPIWVHSGEKSRFAAGGELQWLEQNLFRLRWQRYPQNSGQISLHVLKNPEEEVAWAAGRIRELIREMCIRDSYRRSKNKNRRQKKSNGKSQ